MKPKVALIILLIGLLIVGMTVGGFVMYFKYQGDEKDAQLMREIETEQNEVTKVVCSAREIPEGKVIEPGDLVERKTAVWKLPDTAMRSMQEVVGQMAVETIAPGTRILRGHLHTKSGGSTPTSDRRPSRSSQ